jgi:hypothetical protein
MAVFLDIAPSPPLSVTHRSDDGGTSERSVNFYHTTQRNNPEDSHLHLSEF